MNQESVSAMEGMLRVCRQNVNQSGFATDMADLLNRTALRGTQPELMAELSHLLERADLVVADMEDETDRLKESFLDALRCTLDKNGVDPDERLALGVNYPEASRLEIADQDHPRSDLLNAALGECPELAQALREIAARSLILRGLRELGEAMEGLHTLPCAAGALSVSNANGNFCRLNDMAATEFLGVYRVCLKGALSHFYFQTR